MQAHRRHRIRAQGLPCRGVHSGSARRENLGRLLKNPARNHERFDAGVTRRLVVVWDLGSAHQQLSAVQVLQSPACPLVAPGDGDYGHTARVRNAARQNRLIGLGAEGPKLADTGERQPAGESSSRHLVEASVPIEEGRPERVEVVQIDARSQRLPLRNADGLGLNIGRGRQTLAKNVYRPDLASNVGYNVAWTSILVRLCLARPRCRRVAANAESLISRP